MLEYKAETQMWLEAFSVKEFGHNGNKNNINIGYDEYLTKKMNKLYRATLTNWMHITKNIEYVTVGKITDHNSKIILKAGSQN